ncbi:aldo/keto reductase [Bacteroidota bacterium]
MEKNKTIKRITRKEFIHTTAGIIGLSMIGLEAYAKMDYKLPQVILGKTGIKVTPICYGASRSQESSLVKAILDQGINFLDTGRSYARGQNEIMIGNALKGIRKQVVIQSKMHTDIPKENPYSKESAKSIKNGMEKKLNESLKALQTDYIDIMLNHAEKGPKSLLHDAVLDFFVSAKKAGKIRAFGFSTHNDNLDIIETAVKNPIYEIVMIPYNHKGSFVHSLSGSYAEWDQPRLEKSLKALHKQKVGIIAMKTCSGGTYSFKDSETPTYKDAIKWVLKKDYIDCAAVAMGNFQQIDENLLAMR